MLLLLWFGFGFLDTVSHCIAQIEVSQFSFHSGYYDYSCVLPTSKLLVVAIVVLLFDQYQTSILLLRFWIHSFINFLCILSNPLPTLEKQSRFFKTARRKCLHATVTFLKIMFGASTQQLAEFKVVFLSVLQIL